MGASQMFVLDLVATAIMVFALYFPRHRRKDLVVAYLGVNIGVLAVADALSSTGATAGLGLGLFGVLSIIRLRSSELDTISRSRATVSSRNSADGCFSSSAAMSCAAWLSGSRLTM